MRESERIEEMQGLALRMNRLTRRVLEGVVLLGALLAGILMVVALDPEVQLPRLREYLSLGLPAALALWLYLRLGSRRISGERRRIEERLAEIQARKSEVEEEMRTLRSVKRALDVASQGEALVAAEALAKAMSRGAESAGEAARMLLLAIRAVATGASPEYKRKMAEGIELRAGDFPGESWEGAALLAAAAWLRASSVEMPGR